MATEYRKILLRRGLREELTADLLSPGELGYTNDTNQLFLGTERAINEIQFDPFINAHATIQSWLNSDDCPITGLQVDEDLVIRNIPEYLDGEDKSGVDLLLEHMFFYIQTVTLDNDFDVDINDTLYQRRYVTSANKSYATNLTPNSKYIIVELGATDWTLIAGEKDNNEPYEYGEIITAITSGDTSILSIVDSPVSDDMDLDFTKTFSKTNSISSDSGDIEKQSIILTDDMFVADKQYRLTLKSVETPGDTRELVAKTVDGTVSDMVAAWKLHENFDDTLFNIAESAGGIDITFYKRKDSPGVLLEIIDVEDYTSGTVIGKTTDENGNTAITVNVRELAYAFIAETPPTDSVHGEYDIHNSHFGLFEWDGTAWNTVNVSHVKGSIDNVDANEDFTVVLDGSTMSYYKKFEVLGWQKLQYGGIATATDTAVITANSDIHALPDSLLTAYDFNVDGTWTAKFKQNVGTDEETVTELTHEVDFWVWTDTVLDDNGDALPFVRGDIYFPSADSDFEEDELEISYTYSISDFQFSNNPPEEYTSENQGQTYTPPAARSNGDPLEVGDLYVYTDRDLNYHLNIVLSQYNNFHSKYDNFYVPYYENDEYATANAPRNVKFYAKPDDVYAVLHIRYRERTDGNYWFDYSYKATGKSLFYFSKQETKSITEPDTANAISVSGVNEFPAANYGRPRLNVEVLTENSLQQLYADQHLSSLYSYTGRRSSLFKKIFPNEVHRSSQFTVGREYIITELGNVDWNKIAGTTDVEYEVGDKIVPVVKGPSIVVPENTFAGSTIPLHKWDADAETWNELTPHMLHDAPGTGDVNILVNGFAYPLDIFGEEGDYAIVTSAPKIAFYRKVSGTWALLSAASPFTSELTISDTAPTATISGHLWVDTTNISLLVNDTLVVDTVFETEDDIDSAATDWVLVDGYQLVYQTTNVEEITSKAERTEHVFLRFNKNICTTFFIDYSLVQQGPTAEDPNVDIKFVRIGHLKVINGVPQGISHAKLTDDNTEIWQDSDGNSLAERDEFSNIEFDAKYEEDDIIITLKQLPKYNTEISYTIKRWTM